jgi:hypothetical protein
VRAAVTLDVLFLTEGTKDVENFGYNVSDIVLRNAKCLVFGNALQSETKHVKVGVPRAMAGCVRGVGGRGNVCLPKSTLWCSFYIPSACRCILDIIQKFVPYSPAYAR